MSLRSPRLALPLAAAVVITTAALVTIVRDNSPARTAPGSAGGLAAGHLEQPRMP